MVDLHVTYEEVEDKLYISLGEEIARVVGNSRICESFGDPVETIIDFDEDGRVSGIEFLNASHRIPEWVLARAERIRGGVKPDGDAA